MTKTQLIQEYGMTETYLRHIEEVVLREYREKETKQHVDELLKYLEFADIDFKNPDATKDFEEINFPNDTYESDHATDNESYSSDYHVVDHGSHHHSHLGWI